MKVLFLNTLLVFLFTNCNSQKSEHKFNYDFENPSKSINLEKKLDEISGLTLVNESMVACINDEKGKIYQIDLNSSIHNKVIRFKDKGDFEGIQKVGDVYFVLESNGNLYKVKEDGAFTKYKLFEGGFEFEGLTIKPERNSLLLACKKHTKKSKDDLIWVYEFNLETNKLEENPYLKLDKKLIKKTFRPSGLAFHPNGNLFIISGVSNTIIELTADLKVLNSTQLPVFKLPQAEGICFDKNGGMYLSTEKNYLENGKLYFLKQL